MNSSLLKIKGLRTFFKTRETVIRAVDGIDLEVAQGSTLGLVGESGCGKSVTALSVLRLVPIPPGVYADGEIVFDGHNLLAKSEPEMRKIRGKDISMIFQEPMTSLNPAYTVGNQIIESYLYHQRLSKREAKRKAMEMLKRVGIPAAERRFDEYPHQLSGGMRQRAMIAMALACNPKLLIADEPTTALDVTIQAQILDLMIRLQEELGTSILLITHDLGVIAETVNEVAVMYLGKIVEKAGVGELFANPLHPYTIGLLDSVPKMDHDVEYLLAIKGVVPTPLDIPSGCRFHPRCSMSIDICRQKEPIIKEIFDGHFVSCWRAES